MSYQQQAMNLLREMIAATDAPAVTVVTWGNACVRCDKFEEWDNWLAENPVEDIEKWLEKAEKELILRKFV
jgi:hypothetical protein